MAVIRILSSANIAVLSVFLLLASLRTIYAADPTSYPNGIGIHGNVANTQDLYGIGVRVGFYLQAAAFLAGFLNLFRIEMKTQFAGVVLVLSLLVRWFVRLNDHDITTSELWVSLSLALMIVMPGVWLLLAAFLAQYAQYREQYDECSKRKALRKIVDGQGINITQALVGAAMVIAADFKFAYKIVAADQSDCYGTVTNSTDDDIAKTSNCSLGHGNYSYHITAGNPVWIGPILPANSGAVKTFMTVQAIFTSVAMLVPVVLLLAAWAYSWQWYFTHSPDDDSYTQHSGFLGSFTDLLRRLNVKPERKRVYLTFFVLFFLYILAYILAVEFTIRAADLTPEGDILGPSQLLAFITGLVSLLSALLTLVRRKDTAPKKKKKWKHHRLRDSSATELRSSMGPPDYLPEGEQRPVYAWEPSRR